MQSSSRTPHPTQIAHWRWFVVLCVARSPHIHHRRSRTQRHSAPTASSQALATAFAARLSVAVLPGCAGLVGTHCCAATALAFSAGCRKHLRWRLYPPCRASVRKLARRIRSRSCHPQLLLVETTQPARCLYQGLRPAICCSTPRRWPCGLVGPPRRPRCLARARLSARRYPSACRASF